MILPMLLIAAFLVPPPPIRVRGGGVEAAETPVETAPPPLSARLAKTRIAEFAEELRAIETNARGTEGAKTTDEALLDLSARLVDATARIEQADLKASALINLGIAQRVSSQYEEAAESFRAADMLATTSSLRAESRFNLGHALYAAATAPPEPQEKSVGQDDTQPSPIDQLNRLAEALRPAADAFRAVLDEDPTRTDAAENCEKIRKQIQQAQQQAQQLQDMMDELKDQSDDMGDLAKQQQDASDDSAKSDPSRRDELEQQQQDITEQTNQAQKKMSRSQQQAQQAGQPQLSDQIQQAQQQLQSAQDAQSKAEQALKEGDLQEASERQQEAAEALKRAQESLKQASDQNQPSQDQQESSDSDENDQKNNAQSQPQSEPQNPGDQLAKDLLDREQQQRKERELQRSFIARPIRVERDW